MRLSPDDLLALGRASASVYEPEETVRALLASEGMELEGWIDRGQTQVALVLRPGRWRAAVFRGTEVSSGPLLNRARDVLRNTRLTNLFSGTVPGLGIGRAHHGYARNLREVWEELEAARAARPADLPWISAGHSLGGATATLHAAALHGAPALVSFGAPTAGDREVLSRLGAVHRVIFAGDVFAMWVWFSIYLCHPSGLPVRLRWPRGWWRLYRHRPADYAAALERLAAPSGG